MFGSLPDGRFYPMEYILFETIKGFPDQIGIYFIPMARSQVRKFFPVVVAWNGSRRCREVNFVVRCFFLKKYGSWLLLLSRRGESTRTFGRKHGNFSVLCGAPLLLHHSKAEFFLQCPAEIVFLSPAKRGCQELPDSLIQANLCNALEFGC